MYLFGLPPVDNYWASSFLGTCHALLELIFEFRITFGVSDFEFLRTRNLPSGRPLYLFGLPPVDYYWASSFGGRLTLCWINFSNFEFPTKSRLLLRPGVFHFKGSSFPPFCIWNASLGRPVHFPFGTSTSGVYLSALLIVPHTLG